MSVFRRWLPGGGAEKRAPDGRCESAPAPAIRRPAARNNYVLIVLDSCRFDAFVAARPQAMLRLGPLERRWSYASWTAPSHYNLLMGLLPHSSPENVYASEYYKRDFLRYNERLGCEGVELKSLVPSLYLPTFLKHTLGYRTHALVSLPVLNPATLLNHDFDTYALMPKHNDMAAMLDRLVFDEERPSFFLLNVGETHYPFALPGEDPSEWPTISGVHGVFRHLDSQVVGGRVAESEGEPKFFDTAKLDLLRRRQIETVRYVDGVFERLLDLLPPDTFVTVTSDHGELFGEGGYFGHGPIQHDKVFEVPFLEGKVR
jgi:hypothetical protein